MLGSPLIRSLLLVLALAATAAGLARVTAVRQADAIPHPVATPSTPSTGAVPFQLVLSEAAAAVEIDTGGETPVTLTAPFTGGTLQLDPVNPRVALVVRWSAAAAAGTHRFAKLTLEPPNQATLTHVFDAEGDIDDLWELPLPAEP